MMSPEERTYGQAKLTLKWLAENNTYDGGTWASSVISDLITHIRELRAERPSSEELASVKAERDGLLQQLRNDRADFTAIRQHAESGLLGDWGYEMRLVLRRAKIALGEPVGAFDAEVSSASSPLLAAAIRAHEAMRHQRADTNEFTDALDQLDAALYPIARAALRPGSTGEGK